MPNDKECLQSAKLRPSIVAIEERATAKVEETDPETETKTQEEESDQAILIEEKPKGRKNTANAVV